ncbi:energy-coupled thiamine transporter ThiT [Vallitalea sediminicola]
MFQDFLDAISSGKLQDIVTTTLGQIIIVVVALLLLTIVVSVGSKSKTMKTKELVYSAIAIAIAVVLSQLKILRLPQGGSITPFSMLFIVLIGYWFGTTQGVICGITYGLLQLIINPWVVHPVQLLLDYPIAFGALGLSGLFRKSQNGLIKGLFIGAFGRFICHFLTGVIFFASYAAEVNMDPTLYSMAYNISYIAVEVFLTVILLFLPPVDDAIKQLKKSAIS